MKGEIVVYKHQTIKIFLVILGCLLILFLLSACQSPEPPDTKETDTETEEPKETREPEFTEAFREGILKGQDATVINNKLYLCDHLISFWEGEGDDATVNVTILAYDVYDWNPQLDPTLYENVTYGDLYYFYNLYDSLAEVSLNQLLDNPSDPQRMETYQSNRLRAKEMEAQLEQIRNEQRTKKMQKIVDLLKSANVDARYDTNATEISASLSKKDVMVLLESDCLFIIVYDPMKMPALQNQ